MSNCKPNLPKLPDLPDPNLNKPDIDIDPPDLPSIPNLPGPLPLLKYFHINVYDILMLLFMIWEWLSSGNKPDNPGDIDDFYEYVNSMKSTYEDNTSDFDADIQTIQTYPTGISLSVFVRTPLVYPEDKLNIFQAIYNNYDLNDEFGQMNINRQNAILNIMFNKTDTDDLLEEYLELKKTQFTITSPMKRI